jgi:tetratricopeptide (TPR) repeat protein
MNKIVGPIFALLVVLPIHASDFNNGLEQANQCDFKGAVISFEHAVSVSPENQDALFNLAYSYHMNNENGKAIWAIKRLLKVNPKDKEAVQLLTVAGEKLNISSDELQLPTGFSAFLLSIGTNTLAILSLLLVLAGSFTVFIGLRNKIKRSFFVSAGSLIILIAMVFSGFAFYSSKITHSKDSAVVIHPKTFVYLNNMGEKTKEIIPEGQIVEIIESDDQYTRVNWNDVSGLYVKNDQIGKI